MGETHLLPANAETVPTARRLCVYAAAPGRSHGVMPESALGDKKQQDKGRADADALSASQVLMVLICVPVHCNLEQKLDCVCACLFVGSWGGGKGWCTPGDRLVGVGVW